MPFLENLELKLDVEGVLRGQGADPAAIRSRSPRLVQAAERALAEGWPLLQPAVLYEESKVESLHRRRLLLSGGAALHGGLVPQRLGPAEKVLAVACTIGDALEKRASQAVAREPVYGLALDGVGAAAVEALANAARQRFAEWAAAEGRQITVPLSPGMAGWPLLEGQREIFALLDSRAIGVVLTGNDILRQLKQAASRDPGPIACPGA